MERDFPQQNAAILKAFGERLNRALDAAQYPRQYSGRYTRLAETYGVSVQTARKWCRGEGIPSPAVLLAMAQDFGTTIDYLVGGSSVDIPPNLPLHAIPLFRLPPFADDTRHTEFFTTDTIYSTSLPFIPIATPISADLRAGASLTPSPLTATM